MAERCLQVDEIRHPKQTQLAMNEMSYTEEGARERRERNKDRGITEIQMSSVQREALNLCVLFSMLSKLKEAGGGPVYVVTLVITMFDLASLMIYATAWAVQCMMLALSGTPQVAKSRAWWIDLVDDLLVEVPSLSISLINAFTRKDAESFVLTVFSAVKLSKHVGQVVISNCHH